MQRRELSHLSLCVLCAEGCGEVWRNALPPQQYLVGFKGWADKDQATGLRKEVRIRAAREALGLGGGRLKGEFCTLSIRMNLHLPPRREG